MWAATKRCFTHRWPNIKMLSRMQDTRTHWSIRKIYHLKRRWGLVERRNTGRELSSGTIFSYKLFNPKKVKFSYSCCPSMQIIISSHNAKVTRSKETVDIGGWNCRGGVGTCPLDGKCLTESLVYKATLSIVEGDKTYIGQEASTFKLRYNNQKNSFTNSSKKHSTVRRVNFFNNGFIQKNSA